MRAYETDSGMVGEEDWLKLKKTCIGASEMGSVVGVGYTTPVEVWQEKLGLGSPRRETEAMKWGLKLEPLVLEAYEERTGTRVGSRQRFVRHPEYPFLGCTLDGVSSEGVVVEAKTTRNSKAWYGENGGDLVIPEHWLVQVQQQMLCTGTDQADVAVLVGGSDFQVHRFQRNEALCSTILEYARQFWDCVEARTPPSWGRIDPKSLANLYTECGGEIDLPRDSDKWVEEFLAVDSQIRELSARKEHAKASVLAMLGNAEYGNTPGGKRVRRIRREVKGGEYKRDAYVMNYFQVVQEPKR